MYKYKQIAKVTTPKGKYQVLIQETPIGTRNYIVQKNRKNIHVFTTTVQNNDSRAIKYMLDSANYDLIDLWKEI